MEKFTNLPTPVKGGVAVGGAGGFLLTGILMGTGNWQAVGFLFLFLILLLGLCVGGFLLWRGWKRNQHAARMSGELQQHSSGSPRAISDPGARARLDDLRKKFEQGVGEYRSRGKDLYTLPWYVIVGEPGSGKTEAIRHSNVGFPPGLQDEFQGVGGTINMNWWFTNHAVLLDTAGRLMFEEVKPGEQSEWKEFLTLLKKNRPNCPINGLFLVIPSDSLIKDSADDIARKAGKIAQQLDVIQRVLDVRFPVYVIITKCDKIQGFREFFDGMTDPQLQHQMMGWSNPDSLDTTFRPDLVDQHLTKVVNRLRRHRLGTLRDPVPENAGRRTDEVDSLYALPHSLGLLAPRLRRYLETIFVAGEWSAKPLFLRGIYFTSSMREGAALDEELARAIGISVDDLGEEKVWERERAYFLRDLFLEKVFREKGLVTRATNTARLLRGRQLALYGAGSAALAVFVLLAWLGMRDLRKGFAGVSEYWADLAKPGWTAKTWNQSIVPLEGGRYQDSIRETIQIGKVSMPISEFHSNVHRRATAPPQRTIMFPGLSGAFAENSRRAQQIVFETGVVRPLLDAARKKMERDLAQSPDAQERLPDALATLIEFEGDIVARAGRKEADIPFSTSDAERFLGRLMSFIAAKDVKPDPKLASTMVATYAANEERGWPSPWLTGNEGAGKGLAANPGLRHGFERLKQIAETAVTTSAQRWKEVSLLRDSLEQFETIEGRLHQFALQPGGKAPQTFLADLQTLAVTYTNIDQQLRKQPVVELFQSNRSLTNAYRRHRALVEASSSGALDKLRQAYEKRLKHQTNQFARDIFLRLGELQTFVQSKVTTAVTEDVDKLARLDAALLEGETFRKRWDLYRAAYQACLDRPFGQDTIGRKGEPLDQRLKSHAAEQQKASLYQGPFATNLAATLSFAWNLANNVQRQNFMAAYLDGATNRIRPNLRFPLSAPDSSGSHLEPRTLGQVAQDLDAIVSDLRSPPFQDSYFRENSTWTGFSNKVAAYYSLAAALLNDNLQPWSCEISLAPLQNTDRDVWREHYRFISIDSLKAPFRVQNSDYLPIGKLSMYSSIAFTLQNSDGSDRQDVQILGQWGPLRLLFNASAPRREGNSWFVEIPTGKDGKSAGRIALKIDFPEPLPDPRQWSSPL